jgi:transcriptional regulator with AAA-type ATPase domain/tetratricopeptide (TPR) repeat protein
MNQLAQLLGSSPALEQVREQIRRLVARQQPGHRLPSILIGGETGTGKGLLAHLLHHSSPRASGPFVPINCAAIPDTLLEAELFGYERGAFTDARQSKPGLFQTANRGTIFLDEVGLLPEALQAKLLKAIEERAVRRLGATRSEPFDAWILSATNADLGVAIRERRFREDLYHRLAVITLRLPPLRERGEDIMLLAEHFLARACADYGLPSKTLTAAARTRLITYGWPGNVRELANVMERVALLGEAAEVAPSMLDLPGTTTVGLSRAIDTGVSSLDVAMRTHLLSVLEQNRWNISHTAAALGISRNTLRARMEKYGLRQGQAPHAPPKPQPAGDTARGPSVPPPAPVPDPTVGGPAVSEPAPTTSVPASATTKVRWERRQLVLLRLVLDAPADGGSPHDLSDVLDMSIDKVRSFGGCIDELSPTSIGAVFGLDAIEEPSRRAAHAAMATRRLIERGRHGEGTAVTARMGIHAAVLLVGHAGGAQEIDAAGRRAAWAVLDTIVGVAPPAAVMVTGAAAPFLDRRFVVSPTQVPGARGAHELVGAERAAIRVGGRLTRYVGRQQELDLLESRFHAAAEGRGQVIGISGEPGIGKSRLLYEFRQRIRGQRVTYLEAQCVSFGTAIPYLPILELLRGAFRLVDADSPEVLTHKLRRGLEHLGMSAEEALPALLQFFGVKWGQTPVLSPEAMHSKVRDFIRRLTATASRRRPLIVVIEDLHWIDATSESLGLSLLHGIDTLPVLVILTYRSGYRQPWMDRSYMTQIALPRLSPEDSAGIVRARVEPADVSAALTDLIVERAEGNPFFLEEMSRVIADQHDTDETRSVPETIQEVVLARINRLAPGARRLLETAAAVGRHVSQRILAAMWTEPEPMEEPLRDLVSEEFLYETTTAAGDTEYVFRHALTQDVAYQNLVDSVRMRLHAAVGRALEQLYAGRLDEVVELLAHHYGRSGLDEHAVDYGILAGEKAARRWATTEARAAFTTALGRLDRMPRSDSNLRRRLDAVLKQSEIRFALGEHRAHLQGLAAVRDIVERVADPGRRAAWLYWSGFLHSLLGDRPEIAIAYGQQATALVQGPGLEDLRPFADCCLAHAYSLAGNLGDALEAAERALSQFETRANVWWACRTMWILSHTANGLGEWTRSLDYCRRALNYGEVADELRLKIVAWSRMAASHVQRGDAKAALTACEAASSLGPTPFDTAMINAVRGYALVKIGDAPGGIHLLRASVQWFADSHLSYNHALCSEWLAESLIRSGDLQAARKMAEAVLATSEAVGYDLLQGIAHRLLGESLMVDDPASAVAHLRSARTILERVGAKNDVAKTVVAQATICSMQRQFGEARRLLRAAADVFETLGTVDESERVRVALESLPDDADPR